MADYLVSGSELTSIADAIRTQGGTSSSLIFPTGFITAIGNIGSGYPCVETGTITTTSNSMLSTLEISTGTHDRLPAFFMVSTSKKLSYDGSNRIGYCVYMNFEALTGSPYTFSTSTTVYGRWLATACTSATGQSQTGGNITKPMSNTGTTSNQYPYYWATMSSIKASYGNTSYFWMKSTTYNWVAVWV